MTLLELIEYLRESILDDTGGHGIDWTTIDKADDEAQLLRWTNEQLTSYINEAINQVYRRILPAHGYFTEFDISVTATNHTYVYDPRILRITWARLVTEDKDLERTDLQDLQLCNRHWRNGTGTPDKYLIDFTSGSIRLVDIPIASDTLELEVNRLPLVPLDWASNNLSPEAALRSEFQILMLHYAAFLAFGKDEANSLDPTSSDRHLALFNKTFPESANAYSDTRKRRTNNRTVRYGGL